MLNRVFQPFSWLLCFALLAQGCGSGKSTIVGRGNGSGAVGSYGDFCSDGTSAIGQVYSSASAETFNLAVKGLVSATLQPESLGSVPLVNGIDFQLTLPGSLRSQGTGSSGSVSLAIKDSYTGQKDPSGKIIPAYPVVLNQLSSARKSGSSYLVTFSDQYGSITLNFVESGTMIQGTISYQNSQHISGGAPAQGTLGNFSIASCAVFH